MSCFYLPENMAYDKKKIIFFIPPVHNLTFLLYICPQ